MTPHRKTCPHVVHFNVPRDWFETNSRHQKRYYEGGKKNRGCRGLLGRVILASFCFCRQKVERRLGTRHMSLNMAVLWNLL